VPVAGPGTSRPPDRFLGRPDQRGRFVAGGPIASPRSVTARSATRSSVRHEDRRNKSMSALAAKSKLVSTRTSTSARTRHRIANTSFTQSAVKISAPFLPGLRGPLDRDWLKRLSHCCRIAMNWCHPRDLSPHDRLGSRRLRSTSVPRDHDPPAEQPATLSGCRVTSPDVVRVLWPPGDSGAAESRGALAGCAASCLLSCDLRRSVEVRMWPGSSEVGQLRLWGRARAGVLVDPNPKLV
jgi:hypothetical protein